MKNLLPWENKAGYHILLETFLHLENVPERYSFNLSAKKNCKHIYSVKTVLRT